MSVDDVLSNVAWNGKYTDSGQEVVVAGVVDKAITELYQIMLGVIGNDEDLNLKDRYSVHRLVENQLRAEQRAALKQAFGMEEN